MDPNGDKQATSYRFEGFTLDAGKRLVLGPDRAPVPLMPKAYDILHFFVCNSQRVIEKDELMSAVWPDTIVEENNLTQNISAIRRALGEKHGENRFIATVPGRGYKFVAAVETASDRSEAIGSSPREEPAGKAVPPVHPRRLRAILLTILILCLASISFVIWQARYGTDSTEVRSVAVLPFKPLASDRRDESVELGMADALITKLGSDDRVTVRPLSAVRRFNSLDQDPAEAGRAVNVDAVLDGNIQIANDRIRVSVKLLRVSDMKQLWSGQFDESLRDIFAVQDSIAQRVATALNIKLGRSSGKVPTESIEAYQLYMRGNFHVRRLVRAEVEKGIDYYQQALELDPKFALAYVGLANANRALVLTSDLSPKEHMLKAKEAAVKAVESDPALAEAWSSRAISDFWYDWNWKSAEANHLRALELDPYSTESHLFYAHLLSNLGRHNEALEQVRKARERDPVSLIVNAVEGQILFFAGRNEESAEVLARTIDMEPNFWLAHLFLTRVYIRNGDYERAISSARKASELTGGNAEALAAAGYALARMGRPEEANHILRELQERSKTRYVPSYALAQVSAGLGDKEATLHHLERAFAEKDAQMVFLKVEPKWDDLRNEPRFIDLLKRMQLD